MIRISTNIEQVFNGIEADMQKLINSDKVLRTVALDAVAMISHRVQHEGKKTDGTSLKTKSNKKLGDYSLGYGKKRKEEGRRTDMVDLTMTGDMIGDFIAEPTGKTEYSVGFRGQKSGDKAEYLEDYYGLIFTPSDEEIKFLGDELERGLDAVFE